MESYLAGTLVFLSISGLAASVWIAAVGFFGRRRLSPGARYYIWLIALVLFLLPVRLPTARTIHQEAVNHPAWQETLSEQAQGEDVNAQPTQIRQEAVQPKVTIAATPREAVRTAEEKLPSHAAPYVLAIWIVGVLAMVGKREYGRQRFRRQLKRASIPVPERYLEQIKACKARVGIKKCVSLNMVQGEFSPFVTGVFRPVVVLPSSAPEEDMEYILCHELTHVKHKDLWFNALVQLVKHIHWFNPAVYKIEKKIRDEMEFYCDTAVVQKLDAGQEKAYGKSILNAMRSPVYLRESSAFLSENGQNVKKRLEGIFMKKQYKGIAKAVSLALVIFMMVPAVCGAAVINEKNPANSIGVNHLVDTGNFRYSRDCDESEYGIDDHTGRTEDGQRDIVLINTPFYKTFYASISTDNYLLDNGAKRIATAGELGWEQEDTDEQVLVVEDISVRANINIHMDQFLKEMDHGSVWKGLFTVEWNDISLADGITGYLQNVPGGEKKGYTVLHIPKEETKEKITMQMNFNLSGEDLIWDEAMEDQAEKELMEHADTKTAYIDSISKIIWDGQPLTWEEDSYCGKIEYNTSTGKVNFAVELFPYQKEIYADYNGNYTGDTMAGTYYTKLDNTVTGDEFEAEITGLTQEAGKSITFASKDSRYVVEMVTGEGPKTETKASSQWEHGTRDDFLYGLSRGETRAILPEQLPFTMAVAPDGGSVTISVTKAYDAWCSAIATYGDEEYGLYETANSDQYGFTYTFSLNNNGPVHNIQFTGLSIEPYAVQESYDLMFYVQDGQLFWKNCSQSVQTNEDYSGAQALELLKEFSIWR